MSQSGSISTHCAIRDELQFEDKEAAYAVLRTVLHALRDRLAVDEAAHLGAQLPTLIRGVYYEGWNPGAVPIKDKSREVLILDSKRGISFEVNN